MSSLARRSLRATAAVAGITVAGIGLAGPAFAAPAAPAAPEQSGADETAPAPNGYNSGLVGELPEIRPELNDLPEAFTIDNTGLYTADDALPDLELVHVDPSNTDLELRRSVSHGNSAADGKSESDAASDGQSASQGQSSSQGRDSALQQLDTSSMFSGVPGKLLRHAEGNQIHT